MIIVSLAAQLGTLGITSYCFKQMSTYFLLTNLMVLPVASFLVPCGLLTIALGGSSVGLFAGKITYGLAWLLNHAVGWVEHLPGSTVPAQVNGEMVVLYYIILVLFFVFAAKKTH
jgi:competence protein ComEC